MKNVVNVEKNVKFIKKKKITLTYFSLLNQNF